MASELAQRQDQLMKLTMDFARERQDWADDNTLMGVPIEGAFWQAADRLIAAFLEGDLPGPCRKINSAVERFAERWIPFRESAILANDSNMQPDRDCWKAADGVCSMLITAKPRQPKTLEPIEVLVKQGVSAAQICLMKDWLINGEPDMERYHLALRDSKYDKISQAAEVDAKIAAELAENRTAQSAVDAKVGMIEASRAKAAVAPEDIADLVYQGVHVDQIARLMNLTADDVIQYCLAAGMNTDEIYAHYQEQPTAGRKLPESESRRLDAVANMNAHVNQPTESPAQETAAFEQDTQSELDKTLEARILQGYEMNLEPSQIASIIGNGLTYQKVAAVLQRHGKGKEAA